MNQASPIIAAPYSTTQPNQSFPLYEGPVTFEQNDQQISCNAQIRFEWLPSPRVSFLSEEINNEQVPTLAAIGVSEEGKTTTIYIPGSSTPVPIGIFENTRKMGAEGFSVSLKGQCDESVIFDQGVDLKRVVFHMVNFENMSEGVISNNSDEHSHEWLGRATAEFDGWLLKIDTVENYGELEKALKSQGGYAITHSV